jgi:hypothetical protein
MSAVNARIHSGLTSLPTAAAGDPVDVQGTPILDGQYVFFQELDGRARYSQSTGAFGAIDNESEVFILEGEFMGHLFTKGATWTHVFLEVGPSVPLTPDHTPPAV